MTTNESLFTDGPRDVRDARPVPDPLDQAGQPTAVDEPVDPDSSIYAELRKELTAPADVDVIVLPVPARPNWRVRFRTSIEYDLMRRWNKTLTDRRTKQLNLMALAERVIGHTCAGLEYKGKPVVGVDGEPMTVNSPDFLSMANSGVGVSMLESLSWFYGSDGFVLATASRVMEAAGYRGFSDEDVDSDDGYSPLA
jgi:hypothetical protein